MNGAGCWSTVVCTPEERARLGLTNDLQWLVHCRLAVGHTGNHATDASDHPRSDRRLWLEWNDFDTQAQSLIERNPCSVRSPSGAYCLFFEAHGGPHFYATGNGHAPTAIAAASGNGQAGAGPAGGGSVSTGPGGNGPVGKGPVGNGPVGNGPGGAGPAGGGSGGQSGPRPGDGYRGGRRSTNMEPPVIEGASMDGLERRRHQLPESRVDRRPPQQPQQHPQQQGSQGPRPPQTGGMPRMAGPAPQGTGAMPRQGPPPNRQAPPSGAFPRQQPTGAHPVQPPRPAPPQQPPAAQQPAQSPAAQQPATPPQPRQGQQFVTGQHARPAAHNAAPEAKPDAPTRAAPGSVAPQSDPLRPGSAADGSTDSGVQLSGSITRRGGRRRAPESDDRASRTPAPQGPEPKTQAPDALAKAVQAPSSVPAPSPVPASSPLPIPSPVSAQPPVPVQSKAPALPELPATAIARVVSDAQTVVRAGEISNVEAVSDALDEVASALAKLAAALRGGQ